MTRTKVTDESLVEFVALGNIGKLMLDLRHNTIGDSGLVHLGKLTNLTSLLLAETNVTDEGLKHLTQLTSLRYLDLSDTDCTEEGVATLEKALPTATIVHGR